MPCAERTLDQRMQEMLDHYEITRLLGVYCHGCDRFDVARMASVYREDSWDDHGNVKAPGPKFAEMAIQMLGAISNACTHLLGQSLINVTGDEAGAETYFFAVTRSSGPAGGEDLNLLGGRFVDQLLREQGEWKIKLRTVVRDWSATYPIAQDWLAGMTHTEGQRSNDDLSFAALGVRHSSAVASAGAAEPVRSAT